MEVEVEKEVNMPERPREVLKNKNVENYQFIQLTMGNIPPESSSTFMYISAITACLLTFSCSSCLGWIGPAIPSLENSDPRVNPLGKPATPLEISWIESLLVMGATFDLFYTAKLADNIGRKKALIYISILHIGSLLIQTFSTDVRVYYVTRYISGFVMKTVFGLVPVYLVEIADMRNKSIVGALMTVFMNSGVVFPLIIGTLVSVRVLTLCCAMPAAIFLIFFGFFMPESPMFLASKRDTRGVTRVLVKLRNQTADQVQQEVNIIMTTVENDRPNTGGTIKELFKDAGLRRSLIICLGLFVFQQFSCITAPTGFLGQVSTAPKTSISKYSTTIILKLTQVFSSVMATAIVRKFSKRSLLIFSSIGTSIASSALAISFHIGTNTTLNIECFFWISLLSCFILSGFGMGVLPWSLAAESFPTKFRATACLLSVFCCFISSSLTTFLFPLVLNTFGMAYCCWSSSGCMIICTIFLYYYW